MTFAVNVSTFGRSSRRHPGRRVDTWCLTPAGSGSLILALRKRGKRTHGSWWSRGSRWNCRSASTTRTRSTPSKANCSRRNRASPHGTGRRNRCCGNPKWGRAHGVYLPDGLLCSEALYENPKGAGSVKLIFAGNRSVSARLRNPSVRACCFRGSVGKAP